MKIPAITRIMLHIGITAITLSAYSSPKLAAKDVYKRQAQSPYKHSKIGTIVLKNAFYEVLPARKWAR